MRDELRELMHSPYQKSDRQMVKLRRQREIYLRSSCPANVSRPVQSKFLGTMATGNLGRPSVGVNPLRGQNNVQGSCDMGSFPHELPGYQHISGDATRTAFEVDWGVKLEKDPGLRIPNMFDAAVDGTFTPRISLRWICSSFRASVLIALRFCHCPARPGGLMWSGVTKHPTAECIARRIPEALPWNEAPGYLIRDRDRIFGAIVKHRLCCGRQGQADCARLAPAERIRRTVNRVDPPRVRVPFNCLG